MGDQNPATNTQSSGYQSLDLRKHLDEPQNGYKNIVLEKRVSLFCFDFPPILRTETLHKTRI